VAYLGTKNIQKVQTALVTLLFYPVNRENNIRKLDGK